MTAVRDVIETQKRELESRWLERYVERDVHWPADTGSLVRVVVGPRRAGKSFLASHLLKTDGGGGYVNFDDERLLDVQDYDDIVNAVDSVYGQPQTLLLDEVQNLPRWELLVNRLQRQGRRLIVTGSNSNLLSRELATHLTGRHVLIPLLPFGYRERLRLLPAAPTDSERKTLLAEYSRTGGFPEPLLQPLNRTDYLRTLVNSVLYKDIVKRHRVRAVQGIEDLAHYLFSNVAKEYSFRTLGQVTGRRSAVTVQKYVKFLEEAFLFFSLPRFSFKVREQVATNKKIYATDTGMAVALGFRSGEDSGRLYENLAAIALWRRALAGGLQIYFWKGAANEEVDFVVRKGLKTDALIQVCQTVDHPKTLERETRALLKAGDELNCANRIVLTEDVEKTAQAAWFGLKGEIRFLPLWKWLEREG
ncbi:MAG: ATP-binding protein [Kiritimatiellae bacterium]|nr:ATP-binding protein [Kiritimatiellia bacterium]